MKERGFAVLAAGVVDDMVVVVRTEDRREARMKLEK